ncbi:MAG: chemotaxis protein CheW [Spirochaetes bacterium]|jgi:purine-binding chemotaxis protein CheW|nr:chemotaxis protein CheW [Spirochaetota bacterium]
MNINELTQMVNRVTAVTAGDGADSAVSEGEIVQIVSFMLDDVEYGINILQVHEIIRMPEITRLPNTPEYIKGVINLRGSVIPVVDMRLRFGLPQGTITDLTRIIVVETGEKLVGLLVDNVYQVIRMPGRNIDPPSDLIEGISDEFIRGIGRVSGRLVVILNLDSILFSRSDGEKTAYGYM